MERIPVTTWLARWSGRRTYERLWLPLLRAKLGDRYTEASAGFIWATIQRLYAARRSGLKKELFGYVPGGYARILERFADVLEGEGVRLLVGRPVERITGAAASHGVVVEGPGLDERFDRVVLTAAAPIAARLCPTLDEDERRRLEGVRQVGIVCASVVLRRPLAPYYLTYLTDEAPFTAVVEMTAFVDRAEIGGHSLVYLPKYVAPDDALFEAPDEDVRAAFLAHLGEMYPDLRDGDVLAFEVSRVRNVFAVATLDYSEHIPPMATSVPGLFLANSAHIVNGTLNVDETLSLVDRALDAFATAPTPELVS
jgi:protoporphyrinogen oxidase